MITIPNHKLSYYQRKKLAQIEWADEMDLITDREILDEITREENNPNYQAEDDEMLAYLEELDPLEKE